MYDHNMESTPGTGEVIDLAGGSLGEDVAVAQAALNRIGARLAAGEHRSLEGADQVRLVSVLNRAGGLGEAGEAVLIHAAHSSGDLARSGFFSVKRFYVDDLGVSTAQAGRVAKLGRALEKYPRIRVGVLAGRIRPDAARAAAEGINTATSDLRGSARDRGAGAAVRRSSSGSARAGTTRDVEQVAASLIFHLDPEAAARKRPRSAREARDPGRNDRADRGGADGPGRDDRRPPGRTARGPGRPVVPRRGPARGGRSPPVMRTRTSAAARSMARPRLLAEAFAELVRRDARADAGTKHGNPANVTLLASDDVHANGGPGEILVPGRDPVPVPAEVVEEALCDADGHRHPHARPARRPVLPRADRPLGPPRP